MVLKYFFNTKFCLWVQLFVGSVDVGQAKKRKPLYNIFLIKNKKN